MSSNMTQRLPPASNGTHSGNGRGHRGELCYPHKLVEYFVSSANTPVHIPDVPGCFKLLPIVTIFVSLLAMVYSAYIGLSAIWFFGCGICTVVALGSALAVRVWIPFFYSYYERLIIDAAFLGIWIVAMWRVVDPHTDHYSDTVMLVFAALEIPLFFIHGALSCYHIHVHRGLGRHSIPIKDALGQLLTKDNPPQGFWELTDLGPPPNPPRT